MQTTFNFRFTKNPNTVKLPRKRKKNYIKHRGRGNYIGMKQFLFNEGESTFAREMSMGFDRYGNPEFLPVGHW